jgi:6-phosphogluconolactonase
MSSPELICHSSAAELGEAVALQICEQLAKAIAEDGAALAFVPGGSTPTAIFPLFARSSVDWSKVTLLPGDERLAPEDSGYSNFAAVRSAMADTAAIVLPLTDNIADCERAAGHSDELLRSLRWPADLVWLGVGNNGHIASIFPGDCGAAARSCESLRAVCVHPEPLPFDAPFARVTLTMPAILAATSIVIAATGEEKKALLERVLARDAPELPVSELLARAPGATVHWSPQ